MKNVPDGAKILATLVELYADQMGVKITYKIVDNEAEQARIAQ